MAARAPRMGACSPAEEPSKRYMRRLISSFAACTAEAKEYGACVGRHMEGVSRGACEKEFAALSRCFRAGLKRAKS